MVLQTGHGLYADARDRDTTMLGNRMILFDLSHTVVAIASADDTLRASGLMQAAMVCNTVIQSLTPRSQTRPRDELLHDSGTGRGAFRQPACRRAGPLAELEHFYTVMVTGAFCIAACLRSSRWPKCRKSVMPPKTQGDRAGGSFNNCTDRKEKPAPLHQTRHYACIKSSLTCKRGRRLCRQLNLPPRSSDARPSSRALRERDLQLFSSTQQAWRRDEPTPPATTCRRFRQSGPRSFRNWNSSRTTTW